MGVVNFVMSDRSRQVMLAQESGSDIERNTRLCSLMNTPPRPWEGVVGG